VRQREKRDERNLRGMSEERETNNANEHPKNLQPSYIALSDLVRVSVWLCHAPSLLNLLISILRPLMPDT